MSQFNFKFPETGWITVIADDIKGATKQFKQLNPTIDIKKCEEWIEGDIPEEPVTKKFVEEFDVTGKHELPEGLQILLIELFLNEPRYYKNCIKQTSQLYLNERTASEAISFINFYFEKYNKVPPVELLNADRATNFTATYKFDKDAADYLMHRLESHLKQKNRDHVLSDDNKGLVELIQELNNVQKISFYNNDSISLIGDANKWLDLVRTGGVKHSTGLQNLDNLLGGGCQQPSLNVMAATSGTGKTNSLVNLAINYALKNFNVIYCHLELPSPEIAKRATTVLTDSVIFNHVFNENIEQVKNKLSQYNNTDEYIPESKSMGLFEIYDIGYGAVCNDVQRCLAEFENKHGCKPLILIVDYFDLMKPNSTGDDDRFENDKKVSEELADLTKSNNLITWTASQFNRDGIKNPDLTGIAGGISKIYTVDNVFGLAKDGDMIYCHALKTRYSNGAGKSCSFEFNERTLKITDSNKPVPTFKKGVKNDKQ